MDIIWPKTLKLCLLVSLSLSVSAILFARKPERPDKSAKFTALRLFFLIGFFAVLAYQARWQLFGSADANFAKFLRRYNRRSNAAETQTSRGAIFDRKGLVLAAPVSGDVWGRRYPLGEAAAHPLGYFHAKFGITGVERVFDPRLSGYDVELDPATIREFLLKPRNKEGKDVTLTLDSRLQRRAYELMEGRKGAVVAMEPSTGRLLALVSSPSFDPRNPQAALLDSANIPAFNRAVLGAYPPGSTFKLAVAAAALDKGLSPVLDCPAEGFVAGPHTPPIRDSEYYAFKRRGSVWPGWGKLNLANAIVHSSNTYFAQLGMMLGVVSFQELGIKSQCGRPIVYLEGDTGKMRTASGSMPSEPQRRALAQLCIGQGKMLVTPLHVACFTAAIANKGVAMQPQLDQNVAPAPMSRLCTSHSAEVVKNAMAEVVTRGTGKGLALPEFDVCAKTGTAQNPAGADHAWFTCFAPRKSPKVVITVLVENGGFGAASAMPVAKALLQDCSLLGIL